jgi:RHS repeat-associated protein
VRQLRPIPLPPIPLPLPEMTRLNHTHDWAKAGIMIPESLNANSRNAMVMVAPSNNSQLQYRTTTGGSTSASSGPYTWMPATLKLVRSGNTITGYISQNGGSSWTQIDSVTLSNLPATVYVGLAVTSHNSGTATTGTFQDVSIPTELYARRYMYDGWNMVGEFAAPNGSIGSLVRSYTWGLDVANSRRRTAGIGALTQITDHGSGKTYLPAYDSKGNIAALFNAANGNLAAAYEYSPYGESLRAQVIDATVAEQPFRFSSKFADPETGLVYFGRRYYSPSKGRFLGRDPIDERGGLNLYGFVGNNSINRWDLLGLAVQLYNLEGEPMEVIPDGEPIPAGRWATPTGGFDTRNGGWGLAAGTMNPYTGMPLAHGIPGDAEQWAVLALESVPNIHAILRGMFSGVLGSSADEGVDDFDLLDRLFDYMDAVSVYYAVFGFPRPLPPCPEGTNFSQADFSIGWHFHQASVAVAFADSETARAAMLSVIDDFREFLSFSDPYENLATAHVIGNRAYFQMLGLPGMISEHWGRNDSLAEVILSERMDPDGLGFTQFGQTAGRHQLVGSREWNVRLNESGTVMTISTTAYEQPRGSRNMTGFDAFGEHAQRLIWHIYLQNVIYNHGLAQLGEITTSAHGVSFNPSIPEPCR